jgi:hypothetical protein
MVWDQVMLAAFNGGQPHMTSCLACHLIVELLKRSSEIGSGQISGKPHAAMVSSRTK